MPFGESLARRVRNQLGVIEFGRRQIQGAVEQQLPKSRETKPINRLQFCLGEDWGVASIVAVVVAVVAIVIPLWTAK